MLASAVAALILLILLQQINDIISVKSTTTVLVNVTSSFTFVKHMVTSDLTVWYQIDKLLNVSLFFYLKMKNPGLKKLCTQLGVGSYETPKRYWGAQSIGHIVMLCSFIHYLKSYKAWKTYVNTVSSSILYKFKKKEENF